MFIAMCQFDVFFMAVDWIPLMESEIDRRVIERVTSFLVCRIELMRNLIKSNQIKSSKRQNSK